MTPLTLITDTITGLPVELAKNQFAALLQTRKTKRFERFLSTLQTEMDRMSEEQRCQLIEYVKTEAGQDRLIEFADTVLSSSDKRVHIALALLYANDRDYPLTDKETHTFCMAVRNIHPDLVTFHLKLESIQPTQILDSQSDRFSFFHNNLSFDLFGDYTAEELAEQIKELINLRLLMPDPKSHITLDEDMGRIVSWGMNESKCNMLRLLRKAESLLEGNKG